MVDGRRFEALRIDAQRPDRPTLVLLHEGMGCVAMWRDFPQALCATTGCGALVYSRAGYGRSDPAIGVRGVDYLHVEALDVLPGVLDAAGIENPLLVGHSDGGSIALIYAAQASRPLRGVVAMAPHEFVEAETLAGIRAAREAWQDTNMRERVARYHDNPDWVFHAWNDTWLSPEFARWSIEALLPAITCPVLAIQGVDDEYATLRQIEVIAECVPHGRALALPQCGHSPQRDQPGAVIEAVTEFLDGIASA